MQIDDRLTRPTVASSPTPFSLDRLVRPNVLSLEPYSSARAVLHGKGSLLLDANENPFEVRWEGISLNRYPDPFQRRLRQRLSESLGLPSDRILCSTGSDEILDWILKVFCQPGYDRIALAQPTYGMYQVQAAVHGNERFDFALDKKFDFDADRFLEEVPQRVKVLFLCSPNNPTGNLLDANQIKSLCRRWPRIVVVDEAYIEFADQPSLVESLSEYPNLLVMRTFSKALGRAAIRLGYVAASPEIISYFERVKAPYNLSAPSMELGARALDQPPAEEAVDRIRRERGRVALTLGEMAAVIEVFPSQANFLLFRCPQASRTCQRLLSQGIVVRDRSALPGLEDCIRVTIGTADENDRFLTAFQQVTGEIAP